MKVYRGWMINGIDHCLFETMRDGLKIGDIMIDHTGKKWTVEVIF